jgi:two-component system sensor histidine kinase/response regulator
VTDPDRKRILIVDDNPDNVEIIRYKIERSEAFSLEVVEAFSGEQAIEIAAREPLDIVLLDVMMPRISGFEVCRRIKENKGGEFLPIIMVTAREDLEAKIQGFEAGADDYIAKPFDHQELEARIKAMLHIKTLQDQLRLANEELHKSRRRLVEAERLAAIGEVAASVNHEINNPLCAIMLNAQLLSEEIEKDPANARRRAAKIEENVERIQKITHRIQELKESGTTEYVSGDKMLDLKGDPES